MVGSSDVVFGSFDNLTSAFHSANPRGGATVFATWEDVVRGSDDVVTSTENSVTGSWDVVDGWGAAC